MPRLTPALLTCLMAWLVGGWGLLAADAPPPPLQSAAAVRALSIEEAAAARPVHLRGHLLLIATPPTAVVVLDEGEGIYVQLERQADRNLKLGEEIEVTGVTDAGDFAPIVKSARIVRRGPVSLPPPRPSTIAELNAGGFDAAWIELRGIVRSCVPTPPGRLPVSRGTAPAAAAATPRESWLVTVAQGGDRVTVQISGRVSPADLVDAQVRLQAVVFNVHNANRQFVRANLQVPHPSLVEVVVPPPPDPFARPVQRPGEVLRFSRDGFSGHRVHVRGVVVGHLPGQTLWLRDGDRAMRVSSTQTGDLKPGDEVEVAGFPDHGSYTPSLSDAVFRRVGSGPPPKPQLLRSTDDISSHDADLVQIYAELRDVRSSPETPTLVLDWNGREVHVRALSPLGNQAEDRWVPGSVVRVAGICVVGQNDYQRPTGLWKAEDLQLWLRGPDDVAVLRAAPWLTARRVTMLVTGIALLAVIAMVVIAVVAHRKLAQREEARKLAEVEFSAMLAERNRLARDIHDTLAQDLNAVSMQLELAKNASKSGAVTALAPHLATAHEIVRKCLTEARESIWDMRSHILERNDLPGALQQVAEQLSAGSECQVRTQVHGPVRRLAPAVENNLLRIGQEGISNALKHARARSVDVEVWFEDQRVRVVVQDDGVGLDGAPVDEAGSHFGLRGMRERVTQMHGTLSLGRGPLGGTRLEVQVEAPG